MSKVSLMWSLDLRCVTLQYFVAVLLLIISVDHTRVILKDDDPNVSGSDYINANYVSVSSTADIS